MVLGLFLSLALFAVIGAGVAFWGYHAISLAAALAAMALSSGLLAVTHIMDRLDAADAAKERSHG